MRQNKSGLRPIDRACLFVLGSILATLGVIGACVFVTAEMFLGVLPLVAGLYMVVTALVDDGN